MEIINKVTWNRKDIFDMCPSADYPFYSVTIPVDVTNVRTISRQKGLSFYYLLIWVCTKAINSVPEFRIRIRGDFPAGGGIFTFFFRRLAFFSSTPLNTENFQ